jgi:uncharacterized protein (DUF1015 family)
MPDLAPFRAIRYTARAGRLSDLVAPPYDVISPGEHVALCQRSPHNVVRLILGERASPTTPVPDDWYADAAAQLVAWQKDHLLQTDPEPAFYLYTQTFTHEGRRRHRKLLLGALRLEPYEAGRILPHEDTLPGPKADRLRLLQATATNLSPILGFFPDADGRVNALLESLQVAPPTVQFTDEAGVGHELRLVTDLTTQATLRKLLAPQHFYIADGHHRYETALAYQRIRRAATPPPLGDLPCDFLLTACMSSADPGLVILPTHRMIEFEDDLLVQELLRSAEGLFSVRTLPTGTCDDALAFLRRSTQPPAFLICTNGPKRHTLLALREESALGAAPYPPGSPARKLAATALAYGFLRAVVSDAARVEISYTSDANTAVDWVVAGTRRLAALLPPVRTEELMAVVNGGERMPPKSTYFWPKPLTGLVLRSLLPR